jgi:hypothetical protein
MTNFTKILAGAAAIGAIATPAVAQYYPQPTYPQQTYPQQAYPGSGYGYQGTTGNPVTDIIDQLLGNRYSVTDRQAVRRCTNAVQAQALQQYGGGYGQQAYGQGYRQNIAAPSMRVTSITDVQRRNSGLRVSGTLSTGYAGQYGNQYGFQNRQYAGGDLRFRCNVDYRTGQVTNIRVDRRGAYRRY